MNKLYRYSVCLLAFFALALVAPRLEAASVGVSGYTNNFSTQPPATDWATASIAGANTDVTTPDGLDAAVQTVAASTITTQVVLDAADPPAFAGTAAWSSSGLYLQTRPTGVKVTLLLLKLVNNIGHDSAGIVLSYDYNKVAVAAEDVEGVRVYFSLTGAVGSWTVIPELSSANPGRLSVTVNMNWPNGGTCYLLWADDNGAPSPDTGNQIDNFSVIPAEQAAVVINTQPQPQSVGELQPASFSVAASGNPPPAFQWYTNGVPIAGATSPTYSISSSPLSYNGLKFKVVVSNTTNGVLNTQISDEVVLNVAADTISPTITGALGLPPTTVSVDFSEGLRADTANNPANYAITSSVGNLTISGAVLSPSGSNVILTTSSQTLGATYTLIVNGLRDLSVASNSIPANSTATFVAVAFTPGSVGSPQPAPTVTEAGNGYNVTAGGADIGGTNDQFGFNYQSRSGDFDVKVRLAGLTLSDVWSKAGLMARESLNANSAFTAAMATPGAGGAFFESRATTGGQAASIGNFPVNYPNTWVRLQRVGDTFTGYAGYDGNSWATLGSMTAPLAQVLRIGIVVSSHTNNIAATAQFRDYGSAAGGTLGIAPLPIEPPGPSTRKTPFAITEIMYNPFPSTNASGGSLEFIELYNSNPFFEEISRYRISGDIDFTFPPNTFIDANSYVVIARDPAAITAAYGLANVMGPYSSSNSLTGSGTLHLHNNSGGLVLEIKYSGKPPWPAAADGAGHSLVLARPSYGEADPQAWAASDKLGGSPGGFDGYTISPRRAVVINEFLANSTGEDYIELYNHANQSVDISGCSLSDDPHLNKFIIVNGTTIPARGFVVFHPGAAFGLSSGGETIYFRGPEGGVLDAVRFEAQAEDVSMGRYPDGAKEFYPLVAATPGTANAGILMNDIVINEIMYKPLSGLKDDEYVELYNKGTVPRSLAGWRFVDGIDYTFPTNIVMAPDSYLVVAKNVSRLLTNYPNLNAGNTLGPFKQSIPNGGRVALGMPDISVTTNSTGQVKTNTVYVVVDEVTYGTGGNWGTWAAGGGSSLELIDPRANHRLAHNWGDSDETQKAPWVTVEATGTMDNGGAAPTSFEVLALSDGEWLVDNVQVIPGTAANIVSAANSTFDTGVPGWLMRGTQIRSTIDNSGGFGGGKCLHVRATARGDTMANRCVVAIPAPATSGLMTLRAQVRWQRGWPEILLRLHGAWMEAVGQLNVPANLGTPGQRNSRALDNAPPAIYEVKHSPVVPAAGEAVVVTARVDDPDELASLEVRYRLDPAPGLTAVPMVDDGTGGDLVAGDGIYSATIPGQSAGTLVCFRIVATDTLDAAQTFPLQDASYKNPFECNVLFGDTVLASAFGTYRQWMTAANVADWQNRPALSNEQLYETLVFGNFRAIYNARVKYNGSPYHQFSGNPVNVNAHYTVDLPTDDIALGANSFHKIHAPGNGPFGDQTLQREQTCYWMARQMNLPWGYRRYINMIFNGVRRTSGGGPTDLMEDSQTPGSDMVAEFFPDDQDGNLFKLQPWFEQDDSSGNTGVNNQSWCTLLKFSTPLNGSTVHKTARYRNNYLTRAANGTANDYQPVYNLVEAAGLTGPAQAAAFGALVDTEEYFRIFAIEHASGNWDAVGSQNQQNMYGYKPQNGKWNLMVWDWNIVLGSANSDTASWGVNVNLSSFVFATPGPNDVNMTSIYQNPPMRRAYLRGLKEAANGPMLASNVEPMMDAKYRAFLASGITPRSAFGDAKTFIAGQRTSILTLVNTEDAPVFKMTSTNVISTTNNLVTITGEAPVQARTIRINGIEYPITWNSVRIWSIQVPQPAGTNQFTIQGYDTYGNSLAGFGTNVTVIYNDTGFKAPAPEKALVINEIMYNPSVPGASFVEIYNNSDFAYDLSGWRLNGASYTFPNGSIITNRQYLILVGNEQAFAGAYGPGARVFGEFGGSLQNGGESLSLERPTLVGTNTVYVTVNRVTYDDDQPWPAAAANAGASLQLVDANQDNARVSNWGAGKSWVKVTRTAGIGTATNLLLWMSAGGSAYVDDVSLIGPGGTNILVNGGFETGTPAPWLLGTVYGPLSTIVDGVSHSGNKSLLLAAAGPGAGPLPNFVQQLIGGVVQTGTVYTLTYYILSTSNAMTVNMRTLPGTLISPVGVTAPLQASPGAVNFFADALPAYDSLWLNELQSSNVTGITDNNGQHDPWLELYNSGSSSIDLNGYYLADNFTNLTQWQFPAGTTIAPNEFKIFWADGQPEQTAGAFIHTSFRLANGTNGGSLVLSRLRSNGSPQITDYINYPAVGADLSYGDYPNGQLFDRQVFVTVTPGNTNSAKDVTILINEWMASNISTLADPADGHFDDWFELYNPGNDPVDLKDYYLTDTLANQTQYKIPAGYTVPAHGFLLVWADNDVNQNSPSRPALHANFQLAKGGEAIGLFAPNGLTAVDTVVFGAQTNDISEGRFADGAATRYFMTLPTPGQPNSLGEGNAPPTLTPIADRTIRLGQTVSLTAVGHDVDLPPETLTYSLDAGFVPGATINFASGLFSWTPLPNQAPSTNNFTVRVTDNGVPIRSSTATFKVIVRLPPRATVSNSGSQVAIGFDTIAGRSYRVEFKNHLNDAVWTAVGPDTIALGNTLSINDNIGASPQRFYRISQVN